MSSVGDRTVKPVEIKEDLPTGPLLEELIEENHLLTAEHTLEYWPKELYLPGPMIDRTNWDQWKMQGSRDYRARAAEVIEEALDDFDVPPLEPQLDDEIRRIFTAESAAEDLELPKIQR